MRTLRVCSWLFALLALSGLALMLYYTPAFTPVDTGQPASGVRALGPTLRGLHFWLAQIAVFVAVFAVCRAFFVKTNWPRAGWAAGVFVLTGLLWFTGMLLPWDQLSYWLAPLFRPSTGLLTVYWLHTLVLSLPTLVLLIYYVRRLRSTHHETHS